MRSRGGDDDERRPRREHAREPDPEPADLRRVLLLGRAEQDEQLVLEDVAGHPAAAVGDADADMTCLEAERDLDARRARIDRVLDQLAIERERIGELCDHLADDALVARDLDMVPDVIGAIRRHRARA